MKVTPSLYGQCLLSRPVNCTCLADHFAGLTHDKVQYFLKPSRFTLRRVW